MQLRQSNLAHLDQYTFDVLVVGGGINGAVSAASLAAKGARVALIDRGDFAGESSSHSSNLAWGGIKYMENFEFLLVNKLSKSRNTLADAYPSTVQEIRFLTTINKGFRFPAFLVFLGSLLYWVIGRFQTRPPKYMTRKRIKSLEPRIDVTQAAAGLEYSDCYLYDNDARFVFNFVRNAMNYGAIAANYVSMTAAKRRDGMWFIDAKDEIDGRTITIRAKAIVNATGAYADKLNTQVAQPSEHRHVFSKGVHLIVDKLVTSKRILAFFASDGRLFFVIPMGAKTCIGTTDTRVETPHANISSEDRKFVLDNINALMDLPQPLTEADIIAERCGVRPLVVKGDSGEQDWLALSRKHAIDLNQKDAYLSIYGGKLTDCLNVGEEVAEALKTCGVALPYTDQPWYGEPPDAVRDEFFHQAELMQLDAMTDERASEPLSQRLWRRYGLNAIELLDQIRQDPHQAEILIQHSEYVRCELHYVAEKEMVTKLEDFLRRRSKISQVVRRETIENSPGLLEACRILFGDRAEDKLNEWIRPEY
jgi:alpha-glycerophosphate oxidase/glycerol-3-phosphate dehydrogenase